MHDATDFLKIIKKAAMDALEASKPSDFCFGTVTSVSPLKIVVEQKMTLGSAQLVLTENIAVKNPLKANDEVILLKKKGGQKYLVLDRVVIL